MKKVDIGKYIDKERISFLEDVTKYDAIQEMSYLSREVVSSVQDFQTALLDREAVVPTGIGMGFATPHMKCDLIEEFFITIGVVQEGIEWDSMDNVPVQMIFMIGGPKNKQRDYLYIISTLSGIIKDEEKRNALFAAEDADEIIEILKKG